MKWHKNPKCKINQRKPGSRTEAKKKTTNTWIELFPAKLKSYLNSERREELVRNEKKNVRKRNKKPLRFEVHTIKLLICSMLSNKTNSKIR